MFETIMSKVYAGFIAISMFFLSNYTGNNAHLEGLNVVYEDNVVKLGGVLVDAFENDFEELFLSGLEVKIVYEVIVSSNRRWVYQKRFTQSVLWDTDYKQWIIITNEPDQAFVTTDYLEMKQNLSQFQTDLYFNKDQYDKVDIQIKARLEDLYIPTSETFLNLMLLWNRKAPVGRLSVNTRVVR